MIRARTWGPVAVALAAVSACGTPTAPVPGDSDAVGRAVREYVNLRDEGDLHDLLNKSCGGLYSSAKNLLAQPADVLSGIVMSMRAHPVTVKSVVVDKAEGYVFSATLTGSAQTAVGRQSASQHVEVRQYQDGYRICAMNP